MTQNAYSSVSAGPQGYAVCIQSERKSTKTHLCVIFAFHTFLTSIIQSFVNKCNYSKQLQIVLFRLKSMLIHKLPQTPYTVFPLDWQV